MTPPLTTQSPATQAFLTAWHATIAQKDFGRIESWLTEEIQLYSPAIYLPKKGKSTVSAILQDVLKSIDDYEVTKTWIDGNELLLEFNARVGKMSIQGIDRITLDAAGKITELKVMIRPFKGLQTLIGAVIELQIGRLSGVQRILAQTQFKIRSKLN